MYAFFRLGGLAALIVIVLGFARPASVSAAVTVVSQGPTVQLGGVQFVLHSERVGRNFLIEVAPPFGPPAVGHRAPAIYALDGGYGVAGPLGALLGGSGAMEPSFVISVGYLPAQYGMRDSDLMHLQTKYDGRTFPGGGAAFQAFLLDELRPFIESRYPVDPTRAVLFGHSEGAIFAANVLAERPDAFAGYLIASPSVWLQPDIVERVARVASKGAGRRVYLSVGGAEVPVMIDGEARLAQALSSSPSGFVVRSRVYAAARHLTYYAALIPDAFPWLLPPTPTVKLDTRTLQAHAGDYRLPDGRVVTFQRRGDQFFLQMPGYAQRELVARSDDVFALDSEPGEVRFKSGEAVSLRALGIDAVAARVR
ncbi:alpha/beta hydrolase-fold protein [Phenylobacterium sp.]|uniref:alpha/beta hydrolase n=1 Tax=Phenylobacterium sp. TaxID=1871053 RepID=UPI00286BE34C|nr:alpha/beta hydrolase-fold protein [Phenylobacterium sp.]